MNNLNSLFNTTFRVKNLDPMSADSVWPKNTEVVLTRVPIRKRDGYDPEKFAEFATRLKNHMVPNGIVFLICYAPIEAKWRPFELAKIMADAGFTHVDNIVVKKSWFPGKRSEVNLVNSHEYVMHFCNGNVWKLDRLPVRQHMKTESDVTCPGNSWVVETGSLDESYPAELAELLIRMTDCLPGSVIFDPYGGGTAALKAALKLGHSYYGFETDEKQLKKCEKLVKEHNEK